jgi:hypothetical protein
MRVNDMMRINEHEHPEPPRSTPIDLLACPRERRGAPLGTPRRIRSDLKAEPRRNVRRCLAVAQCLIKIARIRIQCSQVRFRPPSVLDRSETARSASSFPHSGVIRSRLHRARGKFPGDFPATRPLSRGKRRVLPRDPFDPIPAFGDELSVKTIRVTVRAFFFRSLVRFNSGVLTAL